MVIIQTGEVKYAQNSQKVTASKYPGNFKEGLHFKGSESQRWELRLASESWQQTWWSGGWSFAPR